MPQDGHSTELAAISSEQNGQTLIVRPFLGDLGQTASGSGEPPAELAAIPKLERGQPVHST